VTRNKESLQPIENFTAAQLKDKNIIKQEGKEYVKTTTSTT
jgi:hypothetical protein